MTDNQNSNSTELRWAPNLSGTDDREPPEGIKQFWILSDGEGFVAAYKAEHFELVRVNGSDGNPEVVEPQNELYPPDSVDLQSGAILNGYKLRLRDEALPLPEASPLPLGSVDDNGYINTSKLYTSMGWTQPDPHNPSGVIRFDPEEEGFIIGVYPIQNDAQLEPSNSLTGSAYAASIYGQEGGDEYAREIVAQVLADYHYNGANENFRHEPQLNDNGMIATVRDREGISSIWHDKNGQEMLLNADEIESVLTSRDINEFTSNILELAAYAIDQVEGGKMEPTQDRIAFANAAPLQQNTGVDQSTPALDAFSR